jgi:hypothetical protein
MKIDTSLDENNEAFGALLPGPKAPHISVF